MLGFDLTLILYVFFASVFWILRTFNFRFALFALVFFNSFILANCSLFLFLYLSFQFFLICGLYHVACFFNGRRADWVAWLAFVGLLPMNFLYGERALYDIGVLYPDFNYFGVADVGWIIGASFFVIKSFVILKESIFRREFDVLSALANLTFFPAFLAGPIYGVSNWKKENAKSRLVPRDCLNAFCRLGWGGAALYVIAPALKRISKTPSDLGFLPDMYVGFAALYFDFSGYSAMAVGYAMLFGVVLPENFNRPYLATSIQKFWRSWHMSLNWFIGTYLFKPFVRRTGSQQIGIILAFLCAGLWHKFSIGYFLWGIGHGLAMSIAINPPRLWSKFKKNLSAKIVAPLSWFITMTWVAALSYFAAHY